MDLQNQKIVRFAAATSMLLLLAFLSYWNVDNYKREKGDLKNELSTQMSLACSEYRDSLVQTIFQIIELDADTTNHINRRSASIVTRHLQPQDSLHFKGIFPQRTTSRRLQNQDTIMEIVVGPNNFPGDRSIVAWRSEATATVRFEYGHDSIEEDFVFMDRPKMELSEILNSGKKEFAKAFYEIDSIFTRRLMSEDLPFKHQIVLDTGMLKSSGISIPFEYESFAQSSVPFARFDSFHSFLWMRIFPVLILTSLLFVALAVSFYAIIRNWSAQIRLAQVKDEFVSNMTHELKTPISTIGVALEAFEKFGAQENKLKRKEYLDISRQELSRLKILVDKVLKMSRLTDDGEELALEALSISEIVEEVVSSMKIQFENRNIDVAYSAQNDVPFITGDRIHLTNVVYNIIDNAVKYGGDKLDIRISEIPTDQMLLLEIEDNGQGISSSHKSKIFERFYRVPYDDKHDVKGHGLGLHYVRQMVHQHNGRIEVRSKVGEGSTFAIYLPVMQR